MAIYQNPQKVHEKSTESYENVCKSITFHCARASVKLNWKSIKSMKIDENSMKINEINTKSITYIQIIRKSMKINKNQTMEWEREGYGEKEKQRDGGRERMRKREGGGERDGG